MITDNILNYYLLCSIRMGDKQHFINSIQDKINIIFTKKEINLFLRKQGEYYVANELIIGGNENKLKPKDGKVLVF
jgi:hypothetical protein